MVLVGHSMGGVIGRLLLSSSGEQVWNKVMARRDLSPERARRVRESLARCCISSLAAGGPGHFLAAPHRGTPMAAGSAA
jgi:triacylglycerol esterase/lipase EstA (alpha/beta hydrolase family)